MRILAGGNNGGFFPKARSACARRPWRARGEGCPRLDRRRRRRRRTLARVSLPRGGVWGWRRERFVSRSVTTRANQRRAAEALGVRLFFGKNCVVALAWGGGSRRMERTREGRTTKRLSQKKNVHSLVFLLVVGDYILTKITTNFGSNGWKHVLRDLCHTILTKTTTNFGSNG